MLVAAEMVAEEEMLAMLVLAVARVPCVTQVAEVALSLE